MSSPPPPDSAANLHFSDSDDDDDSKPRDYSHYSQEIQDLFQEVEQEELSGGDHDASDEESGFVYSGIDAPDISVSYHDQLRDVLDLEEPPEQSDNDPQESITIEDDHEPLESFEYPEEATSPLPMTPPSRVDSPGLVLRSPRLNGPFLHPSVSRLRSNPPQDSEISPHKRGSSSLSHSHLFDSASPSPSRFSSMSRASSVSAFRQPSSNDHVLTEQPREAFRWSDLHSISNQVFSRASHKAASVLGKTSYMSPTVIAANGMICLGLQDGRILVYDYKQTLKAVCGAESIGSIAGPVTALALSHDHTCVASGHANGHLYLYDLRKPATPMRTVAPTTLAVVATGRKEGHIQGSRIVNIGFIAGRHTALVSADERGLAFYHSLGKMLFVEAPDILRILGQYPEPQPSSPEPSASPSPVSRVRHAVLSMAPLPLGTTPHPTDAYDVVALLTPTKLVVVGLRPSPKTWFKCPREPEEGSMPKSRMKGTLAWWPSVSRPSPEPPNHLQVTGKQRQKDGLALNESATDPVLAYTWGNSLRFLKVTESRFKQKVRSTKTGKTSEIEIGTVVSENLGHFVADGVIHVLQWLHANQIVLVTTSTVAVYDIQLSRIIEQAKFDGLGLMSPITGRTASSGSMSYADAAADTAHSLRVYKGKMFVLTRQRVLVGTMLTWADRILSMVESGDFLGAIDLCRTYYTDEAPGNRNGLPTDPALRQEVIGERLRSLMNASASYAFSEDRMTDDTHRTPDNRGVDLTTLFEGLVSTCCRASIALDDFDFLFEDLFQLYDDNGISSIYLTQMEPFILGNEIRHIPPRITQRLIALHEAHDQADYAERLIWHMDPACLDLNQTVNLCQKFHLYDALIYIYTRAMQDYVGPVVELLGLIRRIQRIRSLQSLGLQDASSDDGPSLDSLVSNAYKIYPYLSNILSGLSYPSEEPLSEDEASAAKKALYSFLFFGRSNVWPPGNDGKLVLTAVEEGGMEPTYPYARQLLRFDSEAFLHTLDIAFEDSFLNDESQSVNRLIIVRILLEILADDELSPEDVTFINIFIARNVPKYSQFLPVSPTILHNVLTSLAEDPDPLTREDRQLAAEYLLSVYNPHESEQVIALFEEAGFYRILRTWYRQDRRWAALFATYINDDQLHPSAIFTNVDTVLTSATRGKRNGQKLPSDLVEVLEASLPRLLHASISNTAALVDLHTPHLHQDALQTAEIEFSDDRDEACFVYLERLFVGKANADEAVFAGRAREPSNMPRAMLKKFLDLQTRLHPQDAVNVLRHLDGAVSDWVEVIDICETNEAWSTVVWALDSRQEPEAAISKVEHYNQQLVRRLIRSLASNDSLAHDLDLFKSIGLAGRDVCSQRSQLRTPSQVSLEDLWFGLLSSQIQGVQTISASGLEDSERVQEVLEHLRSLVQTTFSALVSITSTQSVSFPRLFKRLINPSLTTTGMHYTEFRIILDGMLKSYRSDGDLLNITRHLVGRDLFDSVAQYTTAAKRGWAPSKGVCNICRQSFLPLAAVPGSKQQLQVSLGDIVISHSGSISHKECLPRIQAASS